MLAVACELGPVPAALMADTRNEYVVPFVKPVTVVDRVEDTPSLNVFHVVPSAEYSTK